MSITTLDLDLLSFINQTLSNRFFDVLMPILRNKITWIPLYIVIAFMIAKNDKKQFLIFGICCGLAILFSDAILCNTLKNLFQRTRPCNVDQLANQLHLLLNHCSGGYSFPSAHACNHATLAMLFGHYFYQQKRSMGLLMFFLIWALLIAFAQVYVGVHYPSDVIVGYIIGLFNGIFFFYLYTKILSYFNSK